MVGFKYYGERFLFSPIQQPYKRVENAIVELEMAIDAAPCTHSEFSKSQTTMEISYILSNDTFKEITECQFVEMRQLMIIIWSKR